MTKLELYYYAILDKLQQSYWSIGSERSKINGKVLMYHHVTDDPSVKVPACTHSPEKFRSDMLNIIREGYTFVSLDRMYEIIANGSREKFAVVTFDDVPKNVLENAIPFLRENGIPYALFIATDYMHNPMYLSEADLSLLAEDELCTIGAHTVTHPMLRKVDNAAYEIEHGKLYLEKLLCRKIKYMAFPYGKHSSISSKIRELAEKAGFLMAFGTIPADINDRSSKALFYLPRIVL